MAEQPSRVSSITKNHGYPRCGAFVGATGGGKPWSVMHTTARGQSEVHYRLGGSAASSTGMRAALIASEHVGKLWHADDRIAPN